MTWITGNQYTWMPVWFRLQRSGNTFTASQSSDGDTWFTVGTSTVNMASTYYVGLAACSGDTTNNTLETSTFDNVGFVVKMEETILTAPIKATSSARQLTTVRLGELEVKPGALQDVTGGGDPVHFFEVDLK